MESYRLGSVAVSTNLPAGQTVFSGCSNQEHRRYFGYEATCNLGSRERTIVCVTSGNSLLGSQVVKQLLAHGYLVRVTIQNQEEYEDMKELISDEEMNQLESVLVVKMGDLDGLCAAFAGCHAIFHPSSFIDPRGVSGYSERMVFLETEAARNVVEACGKAAYVKRCIFTSSLLASIWTDNDVNGLVDESCWSSEEFCRENKLWLALGKTRAEKIAWTKAKEMKVKLVTLCPGLLMAPFPNPQLSTSVPYLKGGKFMLQNGVLAIEDVKKVAEAHVHIYEEMDYGACGRYLSFKKVIRTLDEAVLLESEFKMQGLISGKFDHLQSEANREIESRLSNARLTKLVARVSHRMSSCKQ